MDAKVELGKTINSRLSELREEDRVMCVLITVLCRATQSMLISFSLCFMFG